MQKIIHIYSSWWKRKSVYNSWMNIKPYFVQPNECKSQLNQGNLVKTQTMEIGRRKRELKFETGSYIWIHASRQETGFRFPPPPSPRLPVGWKGNLDIQTLKDKRQKDLEWQKGKLWRETGSSQLVNSESNLANLPPDAVSRCGPSRATSSKRKQVINDALEVERGPRSVIRHTYPKGMKYD